MSTAITDDQGKVLLAVHTESLDYRDHELSIADDLETRGCVEWVRAIGGGQRLAITDEGLASLAQWLDAESRADLGLDNLS